MKRWLIIPVLALVAAGNAMAQTTGRVVGTVTSEAGAPIPGASVFIVGTSMGTLTAEDGRYLLNNVPVGARQVRVNIIGFAELTRSVEVVANQAVTADFRLTTQAVKLEGIVAVGYGTQQRRTVTGAVSSVKAQQLSEISTSDPVKAIQGRVPGVEIVSSNNLPGSSMNIRVRGVRSITATNEPLFVVDGVPIAGGISDFSPNAIASIEVLKDASATAIYGSRGANGVVLITTKTGAEAAVGGRTTLFTMDVETGFRRPLQLVEMMNMDQYVALLQAGARYLNQPDDVNSVLSNNKLRDAYNAGIETDWQDAILKTGNYSRVGLGMSGMLGNTRFNLSGNYTDEHGLAEGQDYNTASGVLSLEHTLKRLRLGVTLNAARNVQDAGAGEGLWGYALAQTGFGAPYDANGLLDPEPDGEPNAVNPVRAQELYFQQVTRNRIFASAFADLRLFDGLTYQLRFGPDITNVDRGIFQGPQTTYPKTDDSRGSFRKIHTFAYTLDNLLQLNKDFGVHRVDGTLLYGIQKSTINQDSISAQRLPYPEQRWYALNTGTNTTVWSNLAEQALMSYMGRLSYTLMNRYTVSATVRRDGSSVLAEGRKWTTFPSVGVAWQIGDESFMDGLTAVTALKLRASRGLTGNSGIGPYQTQGALSYVPYNFGGTSAYGYGPNAGNPPNPNLGWEKTLKTDVGLDFGLFGNRVVGAFDWYLEETSDLLLNRQLPPTSGYTNALFNVGETKNSGIELSLSTVNLENWNGIRWTMDIAWARNRNEIVKLAEVQAAGCPTSAPCDSNNGWFVGQPVNILRGFSTDTFSTRDNQRRVFYDYKMIGIWQADEAAEAAAFGSRPGEIKLLDANGDGRITPDDRVILGNTYPDWTGSLYNRFTWKSIDLSALITAKWGYTIYDGFGTNTNQMMGRFGNIVTEYWTPENPSNTQPAPRINGNPVPYGSTRGYLDGSHWRVRNITLGFTVPERYTSPLGVNNLRIYARAQDPFFVSDYRGYDPENGTAGGAPAYRTLLIGLNANW